MTSRRTFDIAVIGAGIAGASAAAELSEHCDVLLLEMEAQPGYHTTGRSAAVFAPTYGPGPIRALTRASEAFFNSCPTEFSQHPLLVPRGALFVARQDQLSQLDEVCDQLGQEATIEKLDAKAVLEWQPLLREDYVAGGMYDANSADIDVHALLHGYLRRLASHGGTLVTGAEVKTLTRGRDTWMLRCSNGDFEAPIVINAAGAWAEQIGVLAGAEAIGLVPKRRTALTIDPQSDAFGDHTPATIDIAEEFYAKPDAGRLLISPANEDPDVPSDVQPDEMDIAICIHRVEQAFDFTIKRIESKWAGLRSFVPDKAPVVGFSERVEGFFWLAAQGGYGIQTAPALAQLASSVVRGHSIPDHILSEGLDIANLSPNRPAISQ